MKTLYRFKPLRTFCQTLAGSLTVGTVFDVDWKFGLGAAAAAGGYSLLQIIGEGGDLFADDKRVTDTKVI